MATDIRITLRVDTKQAIRDLKAVGKAAGTAAKDVQKVGTASKRAASSIRGAGTAAATAGRRMGRASTQAKRFGMAMKSSATSGGILRAALGGIGFVLVARQAARMTGSLIEANIQMQKINLTLQAAAGGAAGGRKAFEFLRGEAVRLGLDLRVAGTEFGKLAAAASASEIPMAQTQKIFTAIAEAGTVVGASGQDMALMLLAIQQMMSKGRVASEELRRQLGERLPGAFVLAAKSMGVTTGELDKMLRAGKVIANDFLPKFAVTIKETFGPALPAAVKSTQVAVNQLKTAFFEAKAALGELLVPTLKSSVAVLKDFLTRVRESASAQDTIRNLAEAFRNMLGALQSPAMGLFASAINLASEAVLNLSRYLSGPNGLLFLVLAFSAALAAMGPIFPVVIAGLTAMVAKVTLLTGGLSLLGGALALVLVKLNQMKSANEAATAAMVNTSSVVRGLEKDMRAFSAGMGEVIAAQEELAEAEKSGSEARIAAAQESVAASKIAMASSTDQLKGRIDDLDKIVRKERDAVNKQVEIAEAAKEAYRAGGRGQDLFFASVKEQRKLRDMTAALMDLEVRLATARGLLEEYNIRLGKTGKGSSTATSLTDEFAKSMKELGDELQANERAQLAFRLGEIDHTEIKAFRDALKENIDLTNEQARAQAQVVVQLERSAELTDSIGDMNKAYTEGLKGLDKFFGKIFDDQEKALDKILKKIAETTLESAKAQSGARVALADIKEKLGLINEEEEQRVKLVEKLEKVSRILNMDAEEYERLLALINAQLGETGRLTVTMQENMKEIVKSFGNQVKGAISDAIANFLETGEFNADSFVDALRSALFQMVADLLAEWIATQAKMLAASLKRIATTTAAERAAARKSAGESGGSGIGGAGGGTGGALALFALAVMAIRADSERSAGERFGVIGGMAGQDVGGGITGAMGTEDQRRFVESLRGVVQAIGGFAISLTSMKVEIQKNGEFFRAHVGNEIIGYFESFEEAMAAAIREGVSQSTFVGIGENVARVLANSTAATLEQFIEEIEFARMLDQLGMSEVAIQIDEISAHFAQLMARGRELGLVLDDIVAARRAEIAALGDSIRQQYEQYLPGFDAIGNQFDEIRQQAMDYNAALRANNEAIVEQIAAIQARIDMILVEGLVQDGMTASAGEAAAAVDELSQQLGILQQQIIDNTNSMIDMGEIDQAQQEARRRASRGGNRREQRQSLSQTIEDLINEALPGVVQEFLGLLRQFDELRAEAARLGGIDMARIDEAFQVQLDLFVDSVGDALSSFIPQSFSDQIRSSIDQINELWVALANAQLHGADVTEEMELLRQAFEALAQSVSDRLGNFIPETFSSRVADAVEEMNDIHEAIRLLAEEGVDVTGLMDEWGAAVAALADQFRAELLAPFAQFVGEIGIREEFAAIAQSIADLNQWGETFGLTVDQIGDIVAQTGNQLAMGILDNLNKFIKDEDIRRELEHARAVIEIANIKLQIDMLEAMGIVSEEVIARLRAAADMAGDIVNDPDWGINDNGGLTDIRTSVNTVTESLESLRDELLEQVKAWEDLALSEPERELKALNERFAEMVELAKKTGFSMERLQNAFNIAIDDFWNRMLEPLQQFREGMSLDALSPLTPQERLTEARGRFDALVQRALAGDLSALQEVPSAAQTLLTEAKGFFASSQGFTDVFTAVQTVLDQLLGSRPDITFTPGPDGGGDGTVTGTGPTPAPIVVQPPRVNVSVNLNELIEEVKMLREDVVELKEHEMDADGKKLWELAGIKGTAIDIRDDLASRDPGTGREGGYGR